MSKPAGLSQPEPGAPPRTLAPLDPPMTPFVIAGMIGWAVAGLLLLAIRPVLVEHGREGWLTICLYGFLLGLPGLVVMPIHDANRRRRKASAGQSGPGD